MSFNSLLFLLLFFPVVYTLYSTFDSAGGQNALLLIASLIFYSFYDVKYTLILLWCIVLTYLGAGIGEYLTESGKKKAGSTVLIVTACLNILMLLICKYTTFTLSNLNFLLAGIGVQIPVPKILLPVGLSFFIFQSSSYIFDIMDGKIKAEEKFLNYALFVSFFPTITSGPIQRAGKLLPQIRERRYATWEKFCSGAIVFLWGMFQKMVVADNLAGFTNHIFENYSDFGFCVILTAVMAYAVQIYADFAGYSSMAIGVAEILGFHLEENFRQPYAARTIGEFWRRWHISLSTWFRDYIYIPMGGSRKGTVRKYLNIAVVFLVSGLWHGASWAFVIWGGIHALYQVVGGVTRPWRKKLLEKAHVNTECFSYRLLQRACVFLLVSFAWIFFRMGTLTESLGLIKAMFSYWDYYYLFIGQLSELGFSSVMIWSVGVLLVASILKEKGYSAQTLMRQNGVVRFAYYFVMIIVIVLFGAYGPAFSSSAFIYAGF